MLTEDIKNEAVSFLALSTIDGVGFHTLKKIANDDIRFVEIFKIKDFDTFQNKIKEYGPVKIKVHENFNWENHRKEIWAKGIKLYNDLAANSVKLIFDYHDSFPSSLKQVSKPPKWLFVKGNLEILNSKSIAIVGTRNPTEDGLFITKYVCLLIKEFGAVTVSGLANGIDQAVHSHSVKLDIPTIAVLGTGILSNYPSGSEALRKDIINGGGTIITEYLPNEKYSAKNFVNRNRLQAGLANIVIPVEWKIKSGTAHTFNFAKNYKKNIICFRVTTWKNREELDFAKSNGAFVFTIPGDEANLIRTVKHLQENDSKNELIPTQIQLFEL